MIAYFRRRLRWKLFFSYLSVVVIGAVVLVIAMEVAVPRAFQSHITNMEMEFTMQDGHIMGTVGNASGHMANDLLANLSEAVTEATVIALTAAAVIAIGVSALIARRVVTPVRAMMAASQEIAQGNYGRRVPQPSQRQPKELDEMGQLAHSFNQMAAQLEESDALRRQLIGDVSHELLTPLTVIKGSMEGLMDGVLPLEAETFQQVYHEAARLQRLVADLQELSRVEAGTYELSFKPVDMSSLINEVANRLRRQFEDKGVALRVQLPSGLVMAEVDADRLMQALINLMGNALQYTPPGGQVEVALRRERETVIVTVADTGAGIDAEHLPHLFTRFYRVDKSRARTSGGSGVGLTITQHLVRAHNGRIWAESNGLGQGSTFGFSLPISQSGSKD
ncbi:MAG: HAMP domain-containing protein [Ardenticatenaceae bacterium]|nr:HAMP domain-containing protein [Anaerolineales bacterium]MCB9008627.1 HAMP domain-containing protein [Ardenticatenaceae bacterium]